MNVCLNCEPPPPKTQSFTSQQVQFGTRIRDDCTGTNFLKLFPLASVLLPIATCGVVDDDINSINVLPILLIATLLTSIHPTNYETGPRRYIDVENAAVVSMCLELEGFALTNTDNWFTLVSNRLVRTKYMAPRTLKVSHQNQTFITALCGRRTRKRNKSRTQLLINSIMNMAH